MTIYRMVGDGRLKAVRIGKALSFTPADLKAFLREERYKGLFEEEVEQVDNQQTVLKGSSVIANGEENSKEKNHIKAIKKGNQWRTKIPYSPFP